MSKRAATKPIASPSTSDRSGEGQSGVAGASTRQKLAEAAARHFAEFGFEGASLRAIHREIGANPASTHYHFGSKLALYEAIGEAYLNRIQRERERRFEAIDARLQGQARLEALITAYIAPHLEVVAGEGGDAYGRLIARKIVEPNRQGPDLINELQPLRQRFLEQLGVIFPQASREQIARSLSFAILMMVAIPFDRSYSTMVGRTPESETVDAWTHDIVTFAAAGFVASCSTAGAA